MREERAKRKIEAILAASIPVLGSTPRIVALCYHSVHPSSVIRSATPAMFERQIEWLQDNCEIVPYSSIAELAASPPDGRPRIAITFDDGYEDNHRYAFPILMSHGVPATIFVTTGLADQDSNVVESFSRSWGASINDVRGLSWAQISEMHTAGFDVGAHTRSHPILAGMRASEAREEIHSSKAAIEDHLGVAVKLFAYPFGKPREHISPHTVALVAELGFESAVTILYRGVRRGEDPLSIPRFPITRDSMEVFCGKIRGSLDAIGLWQTYAPRGLSRLFSSDRSQPEASLSEMPPDIPSPLPATQIPSRGSDPGPDWAALPWSRSPRWFLPREPPIHAKAGLSIYHPLTVRSRLGWEGARALAGLGAFRSLRGFGLMPKEIWEAAGPLIPSGGTLAMARANHPGRFQALVLDAYGRPTTFVKVARDTSGARALTMERESLDRFGGLVPSPLIAPELMSHSEGVLVFRAIGWEARMFPWRLPEEVAFAIGDFFRRTSPDRSASGVAHGDFAPWNLLRTESGWGLVDWENVYPVAPPYFDLFHFLLMSNAGLRRPSLQTILDGLKGKGWVGGTIEAYAAGAEVDVRESSHFLREYLRIQAEKVDPDVPRRVQQVRTRMSGKLRR